MSTVNGRRARMRRGGYDSRAAAERARLDFLALPDAAAIGRAWTVQRWLEQWLSGISDQVRPSTLRSYREHVHNYLIPHLGRIRLASLRTAHVQAMFRIIASGLPAPVGWSHPPRWTVSGPRCVSQWLMP